MGKLFWWKTSPGTLLVNIRTTVLVENINKNIALLENINRNSVLVENYGFLDLMNTFFLWNMNKDGPAAGVGGA